MAQTRIARQVPRLLITGLQHVQQAGVSVDEYAAGEMEWVLVGGRAHQIRELRRRAKHLADSLDADRGSRRLDRISRTLRFIGFGLLVLSGVTIFVITGLHLDLGQAGPTPGVLIVSALVTSLVTAVQGALAVQLGQRLWTWRHVKETPEVPPRSAAVLLGGGALAVVSSMAAIAVYLRVDAQAGAGSEGSTARALGMLIGAAIIAAPWCLAAWRAYAPSPDRVLLDAVTTQLRAVDAVQRRCMQRARRHLDSAEWYLWRIEYVLASDHGEHGSSDAGLNVARLSAEIKAARRSLAAVIYDIDH